MRVDILQGCVEARAGLLDRTIPSGIEASLGLDCNHIAIALHNQVVMKVTQYAVPVLTREYIVAD